MTRMGSFFDFKGFTVIQDKSAMKVSTDACILGAWSARNLPAGLGVMRILDIGTGTGLLALMLAQQTGALIDAVELDPDACAEAANNFLHSPWDSRLRAVEGDIRQLSLAKEYDFIISNPPFFNRDLKSSDTRKNMARHSTDLSLHSLLEGIEGCLKDNGSFSLLLPPKAMESFKSISAMKSWYPASELHIHHLETRPCNRVAAVFSKGFHPLTGEVIVIRTPEGTYTEEFAILLQPFYLNL
jgi:tRNA1Val (adenine37-N6)-methyltransferase